MGRFKCSVVIHQSCFRLCVCFVQISNRIQHAYDDGWRYNDGSNDTRSAYVHQLLLLLLGETLLSVV